MTDDEANLESLKKIQRSTNHIQWAARNQSEGLKIKKAIAGEHHTTPASLYAQGLVEIADRSHTQAPTPIPKPPDPVPTPYKKVAPRVAYKTDRADARFCMFNVDGSLRPGVTRLPDGRYQDEVAQYSADGDGLELSGVRSPGSANDCPTSASNIDGREYCSLPMMGDPTKNTGSWLI